MALAIPAYTFTGTHAATSDDKFWYIYLKSSGTLTFGYDHTVDAFLVGGGGGGGTNSGVTTHYGLGGGGGGGYTVTKGGITVDANTEYPVQIGAGGQATTAWQQSTDTYPTTVRQAGSTSAFGLTAAGGKVGNYGPGDNAAKITGGAGGSGGGGYAGGAGGSDGGNGAKGLYANEGAGQGSTTHEFGESERALYAGGGGACTGGSAGNGAGGAGGGGRGGHGNAVSGTANLGGGGGGNINAPPATGTRELYPGGAGGSGIVVLRGKTTDLLPVRFGDTQLSEIVFNGVKLTSLIYNGTKLF